MTTVNTVREVHRVEEGQEYTAHDAANGGGYYRGVALEAGYFVRLADSVFFLTDSEIRAANEKGEISDEDGC